MFQGNIKEIIAYINKFNKTRVCVIGDLMIDKYIWGDVTRVSPEAPVPVVNFNYESLTLGGAANVVNNLVSLGSAPFVFGVRGQDYYGDYLNNALNERCNSHNRSISLDNIRTTVKTRVVANHQQLIRIDDEDKAIMEGKFIDDVVQYVQDKLVEIDAILISDYGKGVITWTLMDELRSVAGNKVPIIVDPNITNYKFYHNVFAVTPNHYEAAAFYTKDVDDEATLYKAGSFMKARLSCDNVLITRGQDGMTLFPKEGDPISIPSEAKAVYDVSGAGDTVISVFTLAIAAGMDVTMAAMLANTAGGIVVSDVGTSVINKDRLLYNLVQDQLITNDLLITNEEEV